MTYTVNKYDVGDKVKITGTFKYEGVETDPSVVEAHYRLNSGDIVSLVYGVDAELVKVSTGVYYFTILTTGKGTYKYRMDDGEANVATEGTFEVRRTNF